MKEEIKQPDVSTQELLSDLMEEKPEEIVVRGKKYHIGWLKKGVTRKFSRIILKEKNPWKQNVKVCACILLNRRGGLRTFLLLKLWYWIYWRWLYYVRDIDQVDVLRILDASKKKIQSKPLAMATILATGMAETMMMTIAAHESGQAGHNGDSATH